MLALYRKYRPLKLDDILGQEETVTILKNAAISNRFAHAYLFYGPRGTGKTSTARIVAKLANCYKRRDDKTFAKKGVTCDQCPSCLAIDNGTSLDVIEIDAASNRGIDDIRNLQDMISTLPSSSLYKVIIIDEVHMLTSPASNALLKTLEEPPSHVIFILATTEHDKVLATIASRTQQFHFHKVALADITSKLETIAKAEKLTCQKGALEMIARIAEGSVRDAESLLDQVASLKGGNVSTEDVEKILGNVGSEKITTMADYIVSKNTKKALELLYAVDKDGYNLLTFNKELINYLRRVLAICLDKKLAYTFSNDYTSDDIARMETLASRTDADNMVIILRALIAAHAQMRYNPIPAVPLEVAIITSLKKIQS